MERGPGDIIFPENQGARSHLSRTAGEYLIKMADRSQELKLAPTSAPSTSTSQKPARKPVIKTVKQTSTKTALTPTKQRTLRQKVLTKQRRETSKERKT
ncbi:unnamed protein product [Danaus chrysippus]|uniref:(African queen) hypothetical protein n=1 Tax=Danaus chrysippus TaxID=151541 RepID=A0A8J2QPD4_9NEOP|nr:unnamed protein product [Danaus chrysippus]